MDSDELAIMARSLRQTAESLRRTGIRFYGRGAPAIVAPADAPLRSSPVSSSPEPAEPTVETGPAPTGAAADGAEQLNILCDEVRACTRCSELARCRTQTVFGVGNQAATLCFVGEAPGADEDAQGEPFVGAAGKLLTRIIAAMGLSRSDVYICNVLKCRPPGNRTPLPDEISNCREYLERQLEIIQPKYICALGAVAAKTLLDSTQSIGRLRGRFHDYRGIPVLCTYHPAYLLRSPEAKKDVWEDMQILMRSMGLARPATGGGTAP